MPELVAVHDRAFGKGIWDSIRGYHGVGKLNESGEALLLFCALNRLTILNTYFEKKNIHKNTWQHPGSKKWHSIDYIIMIILYIKKIRKCSAKKILSG